MKLGRLLRTLAHLKPSQILWRVRYRVEKAAGWTRVPARPNGAPQWDMAALARLREFAQRWGALDARAGARARIPIGPI